MFTILTVLRMAAIALMFLELLYVAAQRPSRTQPHLIILLVSIIVMLLGYHIEITGETLEVAMFGCSISYLGKPFALLSITVFVAEYCDIHVKRRHIVALSLFNFLIPLSVFTNNLHHLYYTTVAINLANKYSPLELTHGPLYFLNVINIASSFAVCMVLIVREFIICKNSLIRRQTLYIFAMLGSGVVGYLFYMLGVSNGYDTTMTGTVIGAIFISILFFRYRFFDSLSLAKDKALDDSTCGLLVLSPQKKIAYINRLVDGLLSSGVSISELTSIPEGKSILRLAGKVFDVKKAHVVDKGRDFGDIVELTDITDKYNYSAKLEEEVENRSAEITHIQRSIIASLAGIVEARDSNTGEHVSRMQKYVELIARELYARRAFPDLLTEDYLNILVAVAPLHDIGKISIPDSILLKPARLTPEEFDVIKTHTSQGARVIAEVLDGVERPEYVKMAEEVALYHHEKWDGSGYPENLAGEKIPLCARIAAVADVYDAIRSVRCYKAPMDIMEAKQVITDGSGKHFDPVVVEAFFAVLPEAEAIR